MLSFELVEGVGLGLVVTLLVPFFPFFFTLRGAVRVFLVTDVAFGGLGRGLLVGASISPSDARLVLSVCASVDRSLTLLRLTLGPVLTFFDCITLLRLSECGLLFSSSLTGMDFLFGADFPGAVVSIFLPRLGRDPLGVFRVTNEVNFFVMPSGLPEVYSTTPSTEGL